jgi:hypothetical protein
MAAGRCLIGRVALVGGWVQKLFDDGGRLVRGAVALAFRSFRTPGSPWSGTSPWRLSHMLEQKAPAATVSRQSAGTLP